MEKCIIRKRYIYIGRWVGQGVGGGGCACVRTYVRVCERVCVCV